MMGLPNYEGIIPPPPPFILREDIKDGFLRYYDKFNRLSRCYDKEGYYGFRKKRKQRPNTQFKLENIPSPVGKWMIWKWLFR